MSRTFESAQLWLCTSPASEDVPAPRPKGDQDGDRVTTKVDITAEMAAEIAVETEELECLTHGDALQVWVWQPGRAADALSYLVQVSCEWSFIARPDNTEHEPD